MRIGMTYDLRQDYLARGYSEEETAEFDSPQTIAAIELALRQYGAEIDRIGSVYDLVPRLAAGERWDLVFNVAEGLHGRGREAQVPALLEAYSIPCTFADSVTLGLCLDKALTKRVVRDHGVATAPFAVVAEARDITGVDLPFPLFAKPNAEGTGKGVTPRSRIATRRAFEAACRDLLRRYRQPVLVESFLPGREFTVGIVGTGASARAIAVLEIALRANAEEAVYSYVNKEECESRVDYRLADDDEARRAGATALAAWRALGCRDGGRVDLRSDATGVPHFMEVNPLAGLHPTHSDLPILAGLAGMAYPALIAAIVDSALVRVAGPVVRRRRRPRQAAVAAAR